jgi:phage terminase large subunit-like protein
MPSDYSNVGTFYPAHEDLSLADRVAELPPDMAEKVLADMDPEKLKNDFGFWGRESQLAAIRSEKPLVAIIAGRGYGKSRTVAEKAHAYALDNPGCKILLVGRTVGDVRDVLVRGESGILNVGQPADRPRYIPGMRRLVWPNGSEALTISAENADQLRGLQAHLAIADELGSWRTRDKEAGLASAWDNLQIATRLGSNPQIFVATTPRRIKAVIELFDRCISDPHTIDLIRGTTSANRHLAKSYHETLDGLYKGTSVAKQELEGELLMDIEGALWTLDLIEKHRQDKPGEAPDIRSLPLRAVGVDPSVAERPHDECGIVLVGSTGERLLHQRSAWVYRDDSFLASPKDWADKAVSIARAYDAVIVVERNQGGQLVKNALKGVDPTIPVVDVIATKGKRLRAEPVALAYEQGRVHHTDVFGFLEDQMTTWDAEASTKSPDRMDALVWGLHALLVETPPGWAGEIRASRGATTKAVVPGVRRMSPIGNSNGVKQFSLRPKSRTQATGGRRGSLPIRKKDNY